MLCLCFYFPFFPFSTTTYHCYCKIMPFAVEQSGRFFCGSGYYLFLIFLFLFSGFESTVEFVILLLPLGLFSLVNE